MDKRKLNNYIKNNINCLLKMAYASNGGFLITNTYSIVYLKCNYQLPIETDAKKGYYQSITSFYKNFTENFASVSKFTPNEDGDITPLYDGNFAIDNKQYQNIKNLIKGNNAEILQDNDFNYVLKIENTKTGENAFLLPCKVY